MQFIILGTEVQLPLPNSKTTAVTKSKPPPIIKTDHRSTRLPMKSLIKSINKLYAAESNEDESYESKRRRNKKLRRLLKKYVASAVYDSRNEIKLHKETDNEPQRIKREVEDDSVIICLRMIGELISKGICEGVNETFRWTFREVQGRYANQTSPPNSVTVQVP